LLSRPTKQAAMTVSPKASVWIPLSGFTMAEILLSLTIIGVVAAITLPSLTGNINERTWNTQRKALYARFSQAIALMPALNGYGTLIEDGSSTSAVDTAAETFVTSGISKVLKINNICDNGHLSDCGLASNITILNGDKISFPLTVGDLNDKNLLANNSAYSQLNTKAAAFETQNGESIAVYYNPTCVPAMGEAYEIPVASKVCANFVYDLNGNKGPNTFGKDIGIITVLYPTDGVVVAPQPYSHDANVTVSEVGVSKICSSIDSDYRMPTIEELAALSFNKELLGNMNEDRYASASSLSSSRKWYLAMYKGILNVSEDWGDEADIRCVKR
ncbi:MAG: type II secretion system GspH family protein, partial [Fusobacterium sp.]|nr:type II secretion system GspH family protein [Fusobacterium sp.]